MVSPISLMGNCTPNALVEAYKNDIFAGSTVCSQNGDYSLSIDLLMGKNVLVVRVYNDLNEAGPDSQPVIVYYDALPAQASPLSGMDLGGAQMLLATDAVYRGLFPDQTLQLPIEIIGGTPPYALNVQWGDATNRVISRNDGLSFNTDHVYRKPGTYHVTLQATDSKGRIAFLTTVVIINGQPDKTAAATSNSGNLTPGKIAMLWPLYITATLAVVSFWLGERREKHILQRM